MTIEQEPKPTPTALTAKATAYLEHMLQAGYRLTVEYDPSVSMVLVSLVHMEPGQRSVLNRMGDGQFNEIRVGGDTFADAINRLGDPDYHSEFSDHVDQEIDALYARKEQAAALAAEP